MALSLVEQTIGTPCFELPIFSAMRKTEDYNEGTLSHRLPSRGFWVELVLENENMGPM
jgi:hypothetical protein